MAGGRARPGRPAGGRRIGSGDADWGADQAEIAVDGCINEAPGGGECAGGSLTATTMEHRCCDWVPPENNPRGSRAGRVYHRSLLSRRA